MSRVVPGSNGLVIGTAGHIDHGKTSLIRRLTGMDTDSLAEEKRRGISIDLGFAHLTLPNGRTVSFIDVPGHERFIKNMLAGAGGVGAILLIVAANEGVMPQTREHLAICRLLGIQHGMVVLTKSEVADDEQKEAALQGIANLCAETFLASAPVIPVDSHTGFGLPELAQELTRLSETIPPVLNKGIPRLPVDRSFAAKGFGAVVTGTLAGGPLQTGDTLVLHPSGKQTRIRGLQVHGAQLDKIDPGKRTAVNLTGIDHDQVKRGDVLTTVAGLSDTNVLDVHLEWLDGVDDVQARHQVLAHIGTAEIPAELKLIRPRGYNAAEYGRLWLAAPILAFPGDRLILRDPSPARTVAGAVILDTSPPLRFNQTKALGRLQQLREADPGARLELIITEKAVGRTVPELIPLTGWTSDRIRQIVGSRPALLLHEESDRVLSKKWLAEQRAKLLTYLARFHQEHPSLAGAPIAAARLGLTSELATIVFEGLRQIQTEGSTVFIASFRPQWSASDVKALEKLEYAFRVAAFQPPSLTEVLSSVHTDNKRARTLLEQLLKDKKLIRVSGDVIFHSDVITHIRTSLASHKGRRFSVPEFKTWTQISRKFAIPLLEYLDHQHVTRREGDNRIVL